MQRLRRATTALAGRGALRRGLSGGAGAPEARILSGIQPTGQLHLGNYLGALVNWVRMLDEPGEKLYTVVDLHAVTVPQPPAALERQCLETAAALLASGLDPGRCSVFLQSHVPAHSELMWLLGCVGRYSWLLRMTQFKDKSARRGGEEQSSVGLFTYPVLMAADMLVYRATSVPVGDDQTQHLELARKLAGQFNREFPGAGEGPLFPKPRPRLSTATRVMSLRDASSKMSKSDDNDLSRVNLSDSADDIVAKVRKAKMDGTVGLTYEPEARPEVANLLTIMAALEGVSPGDVALRYASASNVQFKADLTEALVQRVTPIGDEMGRLLDDPQHLHDVLRAGSDRANEIAEGTMAEVRQRMGFVPRR